SATRGPEPPCLPLLDPAKLLLEPVTVVVIALIDDLSVFDAHEGHAIEAEGFIRSGRVAAPGGRIGAGEGPLESDAIGGNDGVALHLPLQIRDGSYEDFEDVVAGCFPTFLPLAHRHI